LAKPELKRLADLSQESVALMVASNQQAICLELFDSPQPLRCCYQKGLAQPLLHGASAKALLAHLEDERREELYLAQELSAERIDKLEQELRLIREQGYAVSQGEIDEGVWGISVPLLDSRQRLHGALSLMAPALRAQSRSERLRQWTLDAAARLSARLD
ncbi:IclR family transcriptional regulator, partial [Pseudomonas aeruginosa]